MKFNECPQSNKSIFGYLQEIDVRKKQLHLLGIHSKGLSILSIKAEKGLDMTPPMPVLFLYLVKELYQSLAPYVKET